MNHTGRHFLQVPGPTNVPDRVLRAMAFPVIDHRSSEFRELGTNVLDRIRAVFNTVSPVVIYPSSGTGAWEAALVNTLSPGDKILMCETGHFSQMWRQVAIKFGLQVDYLPGTWRSGADPEAVGERLDLDKENAYKAVLIVHNETSTGVTSRVCEIRAAINRSNHPALLMVDVISSLGSMDYRHDEWEVDVSIAGSQKGLMLPPGLAMNAISQKALAASEHARCPRSYWDWQEMLKSNIHGFFPYTPATSLLYGLREALSILFEEGLPNVFRRHDRHAQATRTAVKAWGLETVCADAREYSSSLTAVFMPDGQDADRLRQIIAETFDMSLGAGLSKLAGRVFRIGHLGSFNDLTLAGTLSGIEMGLRLAGIPLKDSGVTAALDNLLSTCNQETASLALK
jgi:alanine-glyoxylate transaminase/serine-glyoxylate transaminase/serine-pyruvate transaminase